MPFAKADGSADNHASVVSWSGEHMKALFLGHFAASVRRAASPQNRKKRIGSSLSLGEGVMLPAGGKCCGM